MVEDSKEYYLSLPYLWDFEPRQDADGDCYFVAYLRDIPNVRADGATKAETRRNLALAFEDYLDWRLEQGLPIPPPSVGVPSAPPETRQVVCRPSRKQSPAMEPVETQVGSEPRTASASEEIFYESDPIVLSASADR